jgi:DNA-binding PadR family transcriptional regulator
MKLSTPVVHILLALVDGPRHGYAIKQDVEHRTGGRLGAGTLYEAIQRLEHARLIEEAPTRADRDPVNGQIAQRRYYQLTDSGRRALETQIRQLGRLVDYARSKPGLDTAEPAS